MGVGEGGDVGADAGVDPGVPGRDVGGVGRQARAQGEAGVGRDVAEPVEGGPGALGVDVVGGEGRDAAPVVDAGGEERAALDEVDQVRGSLHPHGGAEDETGDGDGGEVLVEVEVLDRAHRGVGLGPEVLDDHLLEVAVLAAHGAQREDRLRPLTQVLADADQQARGERDREATGVLENPKTDRRVLVGGAEVGLTLLGEQPRRGGLQHHAHRGGHRLETIDLLPRHDPRVEVGQQPGLLEHPDRHGPDVVQRRVVTVLVEPLGRLGPPLLGPVAEGEQRFGAPERRALGGDGQHLVGREEGLLPSSRELAGHRDERAVVAAVTAQTGQRDEDLGGVGDHPGPAGGGQTGVAHAAGGLHEGGQVLAAGGQERLRLGHVQGDPASHARQCPSHLLGGGLLDHPARVTTTGDRHEGRSGRDQAPPARAGSAVSPTWGCDRSWTEGLA